MHTRRLLRRCGACWLALLVLGAGPLSLGAVALPPSFDEAAPGDAGDAHLAASPVKPGTTTGTFLVATDETDWYRFQAQAGQVVQFSWQVELPNALAMARLHGPARADVADDAPPAAETVRTPELYNLVPSGREAVFTIPHDGTWYIELHLLTVRFEGRATDVVVPYEMTLRLRNDLQTHVAAPDADTMAATVRWRQPGDMSVYLRIEYTRDVSAHDAGQIVFDLDLVSQGQVDRRTVGIAFEGSAPGEAPAVKHIGEAEPGIDVTVQDQETLVAYVAIDRPDTTGAVTLRSYALRDDAQVLWAVAGPQVDVVHEDETDASWSVDRHDADDTSPVLASSQQRERQIDIPSGFLGAYAPDVPEEAYAVAPDGTERYPDGEGHILFDDAPPGTWRFVDGATTSFGRDTQGPWLHGSVPPLRHDR